MAPALLRQVSHDVHLYCASCIREHGGDQRSPEIPQQLYISELDRRETLEHGLLSACVAATKREPDKDMVHVDSIDDAIMSARNSSRNVTCDLGELLNMQARVAAKARGLHEWCGDNANHPSRDILFKLADELLDIARLERVSI